MINATQCTLYISIRCNYSKYNGKKLLDFLSLILFMLPTHFQTFNFVPYIGDHNLKKKHIFVGLKILNVRKIQKLLRGKKL